MDSSSSSSYDKHETIRGHVQVIQTSCKDSQRSTRTFTESGILTRHKDEHGDITHALLLEIENVFYVSM